MDYRDILFAFERKFDVEEKDISFDVRETCPMIFKFNGREILGSAFKGKIYFYEKMD